VTNTGSREDSYQGRIKITNATQSSLPTFLPSNVVKIEAGNTPLISIPTVINQPGTYKVSWDNLDQILVVNPGETAASVGSPAAVPASAPDFTAVDVVTGKNVSLSQYKGTAILLNLVNYGCNPSTNQKVGAQLFAIKQLQSQRSDFIPISVFCGCCPPDVLRQFARENNLDWPWVLDSNYSIAAKYAGSLKHFGYPTLIFIDKSQLVTDVTGLTDPAGLNQKIDAITQDQSK
jgi:peroxiredoxin